MTDTFAEVVSTISGRSPDAGRRKPAASVLTALDRTFAAVSLVSSSTRLVAGRVVPAVGAWKIDPDHAYIGFSVRRLGVATVHARFGLVSGHIDVAEDPSDSAVEVVDKVITQSSDKEFHCLTITLFYRHKG